MGLCSKKLGNDEKQRWGKKESPPGITKESGKAVGDGREGGTLSHTNPRGLEVGHWAGGATKAFLLGWKQEKLAQQEEGTGRHCA